MQTESNNLIRTWGILLLFGLLVGLLAGPARQTAANVTPDERILFSSTRDGDFEIYSMRPDGTDLIQLTDNSYLDR